MHPRCHRKVHPLSWEQIGLADLQTMIDMIEKQQIILGYFRQGKSKKQLARELGISPHTVRRYIRKYREEIGVEATATDHVLPSAGVVEPPRYDSSNRVKRKLTEQVRRVHRWLLGSQ